MQPLTQQSGQGLVTKVRGTFGVAFALVSVRPWRSCYIPARRKRLA